MENPKQCPFCDRQVAADANKCLWCGKYFDTGKPEITLPVLPIWSDAKRMSILVIIALVASLVSTSLSLFDDDYLIAPFGFALFVELLCWVWITLSIRKYSRQFSFGKTIPFIAYLSAATITMVAALSVFGVSSAAIMNSDELALSVFIVAGISMITAAVLHIVVALKLKNQEEVKPLKEYGRITIIYSILVVFGYFIPVVNYAAIIFYSLFVYKMFRTFYQQSQLTNKH